MLIRMGRCRGYFCIEDMPVQYALVKSLVKIYTERHKYNVLTGIYIYPVMALIIGYGDTRPTAMYHKQSNYPLL